MISISKAIIKKDGKILLLRRASKSYFGLWDFPGGKDDPAESPSESVVREVKEETNYDIAPGNEILTREYQDEQFHLLIHYFSPQAITGELKLSSDHSAYKWVLEEELQQLNLHPAVTQFYT